MSRHHRRLRDPFLRTQPWKVFMVFEPIERVLKRMEQDGTVDAAGRQIVFKEDSDGGWYDLIAAILGIVEFHQIATSRHQMPCDVSGLVRFAQKLDAGAPLFESDLVAVRASIAQCKAQAMGLRVSQAADIVDTVRIRMALDNAKGDRHAAHA